MFGLSMPLVAAAAAVAIGVGGFFVGVDWEEKQQAQRDNDILRKQASSYAALAAKYNEQAQELENAKESRKVVYRYITKDAADVTARPLYNAPCIDADGLQILNRALAGKSAITGVNDAALPRSAAGNGNDRTRPDK